MFKLISGIMYSTSRRVFQLLKRKEAAKLSVTRNSSYRSNPNQTNEDSLSNSYCPFIFRDAPVCQLSVSTRTDLRYLLPLTRGRWICEKRNLSSIAFEQFRPHRYTLLICCYRTFAIDFTNVQSDDPGRVTGIEQSL